MDAGVIRGRSHRVFEIVSKPVALVLIRQHWRSQRVFEIVNKAVAYVLVRQHWPTSSVAACNIRMGDDDREHSVVCWATKCGTGICHNVVMAAIY